MLELIVHSIGLTWLVIGALCAIGLGVAACAVGALGGDGMAGAIEKTVTFVQVVMLMAATVVIWPVVVIAFVVNLVVTRRRDAHEAFLDSQDW